MPSAGVVVAKVPSAQLKQALEARAGTFAIYEPSRRRIGPDDNCIGEHRGSAYVCDGDMALAIGASPDLLTNLSSELNTTIVACGYETVSGTYRFLAAERGKLLRYLSTSSSRGKPFTMGSPLPTEARRPLHTVEGIHAAVKYLGFDVARWHKWGSKVWFNYPEEYRKWQSEEGPLGLKQAEAAHDKEHGIPFEQQWVQQFRPQVVLTHSNDPKASFIVKDGTGFKVEMQRSPTVQKQSWHNRLPNRPYTKLIILLCPGAFLAAYFALQLSLQFVGKELPLWLRICCLVYIIGMVHVAVMALVGSLWLKLPIRYIKFGVGKRWLHTNIANIPISFGIFFFGGGVTFSDAVQLIGLRRCVLELSGCALLLVFATITMGLPAASDVFSVWRDLIEGALSPFSQAQFLLMDVGRQLTAGDELSTLAAVSFCVAAINLLPLPLFNGGNAIMYFVDAALYRLTQRAQEMAFRVSVCIMLLGYGSWLIALLYLAYNSWVRTFFGSLIGA